jgi:hypothetical protein
LFQLGVPPKTVIEYGKVETTTLGRFCVSLIDMNNSKATPASAHIPCASSGMLA